MVLYRFFTMLFLIGLCLFSQTAFGEIEITPIATLINKANELDNTQIMLRGEIIGDIMPRGQFAWVNIQDSTGQMSVWLPIELTKQIHVKGDYNAQGDVVEVSGNFKRADPNLGGEMRLSANQLTVIEQGRAIKHEVSFNKIETVLVLTLVALLALFFRIRIKEQNG